MLPLGAWRPRGCGQKVQIGGNSVALFARGSRLLAVGQSGYFSGPSTVHAFHLDGAEERSYKADATVLAGGRRGGARLSAVMQADGRLVLAGEQKQRREVEGTSLELLGLR